MYANEITFPSTQCVESQNVVEVLMFGVVFEVNAVERVCE